MKDIARDLGVSVATVSRALKDSSRISTAQKERIQKYARENNFFPNFLGEALRHNKVKPMKVIGVIVPQVVHYYFMSVLSGIEEEARARGYRVMVAQSNERYDKEVAICEDFYQNKVCGIIVSQAKDTKQYDHFEKLLQNGVPLIFYDRICTGVNCSRVVVDDYMGAFTAVTHMIDTGCKKIAFYGSPMNLEISKNRYNGYHDALVKHGLTENPDWVKICDDRASAEAITPDILIEEDRPDAFFAINAHFSKVPPMPTPTTIGGHAFGPASFTAVRIAFFTPSIPSAGLSINTLLIFSLPNPFGATVILTRSPGTIL
mgnify:CR=1 FL=1